MKRFITLLFVLLAAFVKAQTQQDQLASLHLALKNAANDTIRMEAYNQLALYYYYMYSGPENGDSSAYYMEHCLSLARKLKLRLSEASVLESRAYSLTFNDYPKAMELYLKALKIAEEPASEKNTWNLPAGETPHNARIRLLGHIHLSMAQLFGKVGNNDKKISSLLQSKDIADSLHDTFLNKWANANLGDAYYSLHRLDSALYYEMKAVSFSKLNQDGHLDGWIFSGIGRIYQDKGKVELSRDAFQEGLKLMSDNNNRDGTGILCVSLSGLYNSIKRPDSGKWYAMKAIETFKLSGNKKEIADAYSALSLAYEQLGKSDSAFTYLKLAAALHDSLNNIERKNLLGYQDVGFEEQMRVKKLEDEKIRTRAKIRTYALLFSVAVFMAIAFLLYRNNRQRTKANLLLQQQKEEIAEQKENIETTLIELKATQAQLIQSEKMASLGELTAGIAHEIQNPLNFINNFSEINAELLEEQKLELEDRNIKQALRYADEIKQNEDKIGMHGKRADAIVKSMLEHSRTAKGEKQPTDINALLDEYLRLAYHGFRAKDQSFYATIETHLDETIGKMNLVPQDLGRVLLNLFNNAFYAVAEKKRQAGDEYEPSVTISTKRFENSMQIGVRDNGMGIPQNLVEKIFQPFFTTKPTGEGTGLGLSLSYDIIKAHGGELKAESKEGEGATFSIQLPLS